MRLHNASYNSTWRLSGCLVFLVAWHILASDGGSLAFATPLETLSAAVSLLSQWDFWSSGVLPTLWRVLAGFWIGVAVGGSLGFCAGIYQGVELFLLPFRWVLSSVPGVVLVILVMLWCGSGSSMVIIIVSLTVIPTMYLAIQEGIATIDENLCEMARAYNLSPYKKLTALYLPAVSAPLISSCVVALGGGMRIAILGETLGASQGLGYTLALARSNLDTAELYAVALISMLLVSLIEATLLRHIKRKLQRGENV